MFPGSPFNGAPGSSSSQKSAANNNTSFESLAIAAKQGSVAAVLGSLDALTQPVKNDQLIEYVASLQNDNKIFTAIVCWLALLEKFIFTANRNLIALTDKNISSLKSQLEEYRENLKKYAPQIQKHEATIKSSQTQNAEAIRNQQSELYLLDQSLADINISEYEEIIDWEQRYQSVDKSINEAGTLTYENSWDIIDPVTTLYRDSVGGALDIANKDQLEDALAEIRRKIDSKKDGKKQDILKKVALRQALLKSIEKLQNTALEKELARLKSQQEDTLTEIKRIGSIIKKDTLIEDIKHPLSVPKDDRSIEESLRELKKLIANNEHYERNFLEFENAWWNIKTIIGYLNTCSNENNIRKFLSLNTLIEPPTNDSATHIKNILWENNDLTNTQSIDRLRLLATQYGCIVAEIFIAYRNNALGFEQLAQRGQELKTSNPTEAFSCFLATLEHNDAAAYSLAEILETQHPQYRTTNNQDPTRTWRIAQTILANKRKDSSQVTYHEQLALARNNNPAQASLQVDPLDKSPATLEMHERWNIIDAISKPRNTPVIKILNGHSSEKLAVTLQALQAAVTTGSVTAALHWQALSNGSIDLLAEGKKFQQSNNLPAAAACLLAAIKQKNVAAASPLAALLNHCYPSCWIDSPLKLQYRTEFLAQGLIEYFCCGNEEAAENSYKIAIENNGLAAAFYWLLMKRGKIELAVSDSLVREGAYYRDNNKDLATAITYFRAAMMLGNTEAMYGNKQTALDGTPILGGLLGVFEQYNKENPFKSQNFEGSKSTVLALAETDVSKKIALLETAVKVGSIPAAFYLAQINQLDCAKLANQGLAHAGNKEAAAACACWLVGIEQGDIDAAFYFIQQTTVNSEIERNHNPIDRGNSLKQQGKNQNRFLAAAAFFGGAFKCQNIVADYHLANMLKTLYQEWQTALQKGDRINSTRISVLYTQIMQIRAAHFHLQNINYSPKPDLNASTITANHSIESAGHVIDALYRSVQDHGVVADGLFEHFVGLYSNERNSANLEQYTNNITIANAKRLHPNAAETQNIIEKKLFIANQYAIEWQWAPGANRLALKHYTELANLNSLPAIFNLIQAYMLGELGLPISYEIAGKYIAQIDKLQNKEAWLQLGMAFDQGQYGLPCNATIARHYYKKVGHFRDGIAEREIVISQLNEKYLPELKDLQTSMRTPHVFFILGQLYDENSDPKYSVSKYDPNKYLKVAFIKNQMLALAYYQLAALSFSTPNGESEPHPEACKVLAKIYKNGLLSVEKDNKAAADYLAKATKGEQKARYNHTAAIDSCEHAIKAGNSEVAYLLARHYEQGNAGLGIAKDLTKSLGYYQTAAKMGHPFALIKLITKTRKPNSESIVPDSEKLNTYENQLVKLTNPEILFFLSHKTIESVRGSNDPKVNEKAEKVANLYYACALQLSDIYPTNLSNQCERCDLAALSLFSNSDRTKQQKLAASSQHPQNLLKLGHIYEHALSDPNNAFNYYQLILATPFEQAKNKWALGDNYPRTLDQNFLYFLNLKKKYQAKNMSDVEIKEKLSAAWDAYAARNSDGVLTKEQYQNSEFTKNLILNYGNEKQKKIPQKTQASILEDTYGLAAFKLGQACEAKNDLANAKIYYDTATQHNNVDALLRLGQAITRNELLLCSEHSSFTAFEYYTRALNLFPNTLYKTSNAFLMFGLALENSFFNLYGYRDTVKFIEQTTKENNIDTATLLSALAEQASNAYRISCGDERPWRLSDFHAPAFPSYLDFYSREPCKKIAAIFKKIAAEMDKGCVDAVLDLDALNDPQYLPNYLQSPNALWDYYLPYAEKNYTPVLMRLGRSYDPILETVPPHNNLNLEAIINQEPSSSPVLNSEIYRYYKWIKYLGLSPAPNKFYSERFTKNKRDSRKAIEYYSRAAETNSQCLLARAALAPAFLFGCYDTEPDLNTGRQCYQEMITLYESGIPCNTFEMYFGFPAVERADTNYHGSPLAQQEGWSTIYDAAQVALGNGATVPIHQLPANQLFALAQYHTTFSPTNSLEQPFPTSLTPAAGMTPTPSGMATPAGSPKKYSPRVPGSESPNLTSRGVLNLQPTDASSPPPSPARSSTMATASNLKRSPSRASTRSSSVYLTMPRRTPSTHTSASSGAAKPSGIAVSVSATSTQASYKSKGSLLTRAASALTRSGSVDRSRSSVEPKKLGPWEKFLYDLFPQQNNISKQDLIEYSSENEYVTSYAKLNFYRGFLCFPTWEHPPTEADQFALNYYHLAAQKNYVYALIELVRIYLFGLAGQPINPEIAKNYYCQAIILTKLEASYPSGLYQKEINTPRYLYNLGKQYESAISLDFDNRKTLAFHCFQQAAVYDTDALFRLAEVYARGELNQLVETRKAISLYKQAISRTKLPPSPYGSDRWESLPPYEEKLWNYRNPRNGFYLFLCGLAYEKNFLSLSPPPNLQDAISYYNLAAKANNPEAIDKLLNLEYNCELSPLSKDESNNLHILNQIKFYNLICSLHHSLSYLWQGRYYDPSLDFLKDIKEKNSALSLIYYLCSIGEAVLPKQKKTRLKMLIEQENHARIADFSERKESLEKEEAERSISWQPYQAVGALRAEIMGRLGEPPKMPYYLSDEPELMNKVINTYIQAISNSTLAPIPSAYIMVVKRLIDLINNSQNLHQNVARLASRLTEIKPQLERIDYILEFEYYFGISPT